MATLVPLSYQVPAGTTMVRGGLGAAAVAPFIATQPVAQTAIAGATATFTVTATGTIPLAYQWRLNGVDIPGATFAQYTTPALALADSGKLYSVRVSNAGGSVISAEAALTVTAATPLVGTKVAQPISNASEILLDGWSPEGGRYTRGQETLRKAAGPSSITFRGYKTTAPDGPRQFVSSSYSLIVDGTVRATTAVPPGATSGTFSVDFTGEPPGWKKLEVGGLGAGETAPVWFLHVGAAGAATYTPVVRGSYHLTQLYNGEDNAHAYAPTSYAPTPRPLAPRPVEFFSTALTRSQLHNTHVVPRRFGDMHRPELHADGLLTTFSWQSYHYYHMVDSLPRYVPCLDGPRGVGCLAMATHLAVGHAKPDGTNVRGTLYFCDPWRFGKVKPDGEIVTLAGYRHRNGIKTYHLDTQDLELVGDWSAIPAERRGFHELWGVAWDERTLSINEAAAPISSEGNEKPHLIGPVAFLTDTQNNRIIKLQFHAADRNPPAVTEFITGLQDPWDIVFNDGFIYVSERKAHRIAKYNADTGAFVAAEVTGVAYATVTSNRETVLSVSRDVARTADTVAPEGLYLMDEWLYFGSHAQQQVRRKNLTTGVIEVVVNLPDSGVAKYVKLCVGDGTFGPKFSVFVSRWHTATFGHAECYLPNGTVWEGPWSNASGIGGGAWGGFTYSTAVGQGYGRLLFGGSDEGLMMLTKRQPADLGRTAAFESGDTKWIYQGWNLLHGQGGYGFFNLPLPWGVDSDIDAYLRLYGHTPPT